MAWTVFSTRCCSALDREGRARRRLLRAAAGALLLAPLQRLAQAQAAQPQWRVALVDDALVVDARVPLQLPAAVHDALLRGVALTFVWQLEVRRPLWYWTDRQLLRAQRWVRLAYQPLTQRWRVSVHEADATNPALQRSLDTLDDALALVRSSQRWRVPLPQPLHADDQILLAFELDSGRLPRPLQWWPGADQHEPLGWRTALPAAVALATEDRL
ncbi:DUF4390 domain-containing protein [Tepidimonas aquatica]|uniref:DUF4390 domain-containing protein n=1 Tax=Tepidimonas aquatica TaxID=247482 RepID=UPI00163DA83F|nr:DUF4390 domain-containing protein [Tepidimonas aquatica]